MLSAAGTLVFTVLSWKPKKIAQQIQGTTSKQEMFSQTMLVGRSSFEDI